jgi:hypothetical protein
VEVTASTNEQTRRLFTARRENEREKEGVAKDASAECVAFTVWVGEGWTAQTGKRENCQKETRVDVDDAERGREREEKVDGETLEEQQFCFCPREREIREERATWRAVRSRRGTSALKRLCCRGS